MPLRTPYLVGAAAASLALVGALRLAVPEHHPFPPLHPELLSPTTAPAAATPDARVAVPKLDGLTLDQAVQALCLNGLYVKPQVDSKPAGPDMVDKVITQDTAAGTLVARGTLVGVTLGRNETLSAAGAGGL